MRHIFLFLILINSPKVFASEAIFSAWKKGKFDQAIDLCIDLDQRLLAKTIRASRLLDPGYRGHYCSAAMDFLKKNPMWIQRTAIVQKGEALMHRWSASDVTAWCGKYPPISGKAHRLYAIAFEKQYAITQKTILLIRKGWVYGSFSQDEFRDYLTRYGMYLDFQTHQDRLSALILEENIPAIRDLLPLLSELQRNKANDCILLLQKDKRSLEIFSSYDSNGRDKDLVYAFFKSHKDGVLTSKKSLILLYDSLCKISLEQIYFPNWSGLRDVLAREFIARKEYLKAYKVISDPINGNKFLSGWILLNYLSQPKLALEHFLQVIQHAKSSHIYSKGYYWLAKSFTSLGRNKEANVAFYRSAFFYNTFYGQLSLVSLRTKQFSALNSELRKTPLKNYEEMLKVVGLLKQYGRYDVARPMCKVLFSKLTRPEILYSLDFLAISDNLATACHWNYTIGELAAERGVFVTKYLYPQLANLLKNSEESSLIHAVVRQESGFDPKAKSGTNACGLMQILPNTGLSLARSHAIDASQLNLFDSKINLTIGSLYLTKLLRRYNGNYVLGLAAYNAGPSKVYQWTKNNGKLVENSTVFEIADWIEKIPFLATRVYVQGVIASKTIYKTLLSGRRSILIDKDLELFKVKLALKMGKNR